MTAMMSPTASEVAFFCDTLKPIHAAISDQKIAINTAHTTIIANRIRASSEQTILDHPTLLVLPALVDSAEPRLTFLMSSVAPSFLSFPTEPYKFHSKSALISVPTTHSVSIWEAIAYAVRPSRKCRIAWRKRLLE